MESSSYFKSACTHCGGNIEAPSEGAGAWVHCPHCGQKTQLIAPPPKIATPNGPSAPPAKKSATRWIVIIGLAGLVCVGLLVAGALFFVRTSTSQRTVVTSPPVSHPIGSPKVKPPDAEAQPDLWNGLKPGPITIEKPSKGKLMYAVGAIRNDTDKQRYGVKVTLDIFDANGEKVGVASDYTQFIDAHKEWNFKALVTSSKATAAKVSAITEN